MANTCQSCGAEAASEDAAHCHRCGAPLGATEDTWPSTGGEPTAGQASSGVGDDAPGDWRTAPDDPGIGGDIPPAPRDPHGPHAGDGVLSKDATNWAMGAHLSAFLGAWVALAFLGPLVVWLMKRDEDPFVARHAREALNFNLLMLILFAVGVVGSILTLGLGVVVFVPLMVIIGLAWVVLTIMAAVKAANGEEYSYPFNISLVK